MSKIQAVLFDLDGVLVDTTEHILSAFNHCLSAKNLPLINEEILGPLAGIPLDVCYPQLGVKPEELKETILEHRRHQRENRHLVKPYLHVESVLKELRQKGFKLGIVTSRFESEAEIIFALTGFNKLVDWVVVRDHTEHGKPSPKPFLLCAEKLGVKPENCLVVGDGCSDMTAGKAGGMKTVRAKYGYGGLAPCDYGDFEIEKIEDLPKLVS